MEFSKFFNTRGEEIYGKSKMSEGLPNGTHQNLMLKTGNIFIQVHLHCILVR